MRFLLGNPFQEGILLAVSFAYSLSAPEIVEG